MTRQSFHRREGSTLPPKDYGEPMGLMPRTPTRWERVKAWLRRVLGWS